MSVSYDMEQGLATDIFEFYHGKMLFKDAIVMPLVEYNALSQAELETIKQKRFDAWVAATTTPNEDNV